MKEVLSSIHHYIKTSVIPLIYYTAISIIVLLLLFSVIWYIILGKDGILGIIYLGATLYDFLVAFWHLILDVLFGAV